MRQREEEGRDRDEVNEGVEQRRGVDRVSWDEAVQEWH